MLVVMRMAALAFVVGCSGSQRPAAATNDLGCKQDAVVRTECEGRGSGFVYGMDPLFGCSGTELGPEDQAKTDAAGRAKSCECMTMTDYNARQHRCETMP